MDGPPPGHYEVCVSMLGAAAHGGCAAAVPLLLAAGAEVSLSDINAAIEQGCVEVPAALLRAGGPLPQAPQPPEGQGYCNGFLDHACACPLLQVLRHAPEHGLRRSAQLAQLLLDAGYAPTVYADGVGIADLECNYTTEERFCPARVPLWVLISGKRADWSPGLHRHMLPAFKSAVRTLLLIAQRARATSGRAGARPEELASAQLARLPQKFLLRIIGLAANPISCWLYAE
ncbi:hypothetical protein ABPG75_000343 [Micractinium tetrahymenae]